MTVEVRGCSTSVTWVMKVGRCARRRGHQGPQNQCFGTPEAYLGTPEAYLLMTYYLRKRRKKNKNLSQQQLSTVLKKKLIQIGNQPSLFCFITFHLCCSRGRDREVFCLKFQKQLYHHARLRRERERLLTHISLSSVCSYLL